MKRFLFPVVQLIVIAGLLVVVGLLLGKKQLGFTAPLVTEKTERSAHTVIKEVLPIGEYASLAYHYTSVIKDISARDFKGWTIPFTTRKYIFTYDGTIKLGIDGTQIQVEELEPEGSTAGESTAVQSGAGGLPVIRIILPPIKILSHEIIDDSIEVFEQSQTIFNEINIAETFRVNADRKHELEEKVMSSAVVKEAQASTEQQLGALLRALPGIRDTYKLEFVWQTVNPADSAPSPVDLAGTQAR